MIKIGVIGQVVIDQIFGTRSHSEKISEAEDPKSVEIGGKAFNVAAAFAKLEYETYLISAVGDDEEGLQARLAIQHANIDDRFVVGETKQRRCISTPIASLTEGRFGERQVEIKIDAEINKRYRAACQLAQHLSFEPDILVYTLEFEDEVMPAVSDLVRDLKKNNPAILVVGNPAPRRPAGQNIHPVVGELLRLSNGLVPNRYEAESLLGSESSSIEKPESPLSKKAKRISEVYGTRWCVITLGKAGWAWWENNSDHGESKLHPAKLQNKVGASDVFTATLCASLYADDQLSTACQIAAFAAKIAVSRDGGVERYPDREDILKFIRRSGRPHSKLNRVNFFDGGPR